MNASNLIRGGIVAVLAATLFMAAVKAFRSGDNKASAALSAVGTASAAAAVKAAQSSSARPRPDYDPLLEEVRYNISIDLLDGQIGGIEAREGDDRFRFAAGLPFPNNPVTAFHQQYAEGAEAMEKLRAGGVVEKDPRMRDRQVVQEVLARDLDLAVNQLITMMKTERETEMKSRRWVRQQLSR